MHVFFTCNINVLRGFARALQACNHSRASPVTFSKPCKLFFHRLEFFNSMVTFFELQSAVAVADRQPHMTVYLPCRLSGSLYYTGLCWLGQDGKCPPSAKYWGWILHCKHRESHQLPGIKVFCFAYDTCLAWPNYFKAISPGQLVWAISQNFATWLRPDGLDFCPQVFSGKPIVENIDCFFMKVLLLKCGYRTGTQFIFYMWWSRQV